METPVQDQPVATQAGLNKPQELIYVANIGGGPAYAGKRAVVVLVFESDDAGFRFGWSLCQPNDAFSKRVGIKLAKRRLAYLKMMGVEPIPHKLLVLPTGPVDFPTWFKLLTESKDIQDYTRDLMMLDVASVASPGLQRAVDKVSQKLEHIATGVSYKGRNAQIQSQRQRLIGAGMAKSFGDVGLPEHNQASLDKAFQEVVKTNLAFNNAGGKLQAGADGETVLAYLTENEALLKKQLEMVREEVKDELMTANGFGVRDALCDAAVFTLGAYHYLGFGPSALDVVRVEHQPDAKFQFMEASVDLESRLDNVLASLNKAVTTKNPHVAIGFLINLDDLLTSIIGFHGLTKYNFWLDMQSVFESNMSKFVDTTEEAEAAKAAYAAQGVEAEIDYNASIQRYFVRSAKDQTVGDKVYPKGKFLKGLGFHEPRFVA